MSSASFDRGPLSVDNWDANWEAGSAAVFDAGSFCEPAADAWVDQGEADAPEAHWGGVEGGEAWSQQIWDVTTWGTAALIVADERSAEPTEAIWPVTRRFASGPSEWRGPEPDAMRFDVFYRRDLVFTPVLASARAASPVMTLSEHVGNGALWRHTTRALCSNLHDIAGSEFLPDDAEPRWPSGARPVIRASLQLSPRPRCFGRRYDHWALDSIAAAPAQPSLTPPLPVVLDGTLRNALGQTALAPRPRAFGPQPPEALRRQELRDALRSRPRRGAAQGAGVLTIGALFDALAIECEAIETQDRLAALERSSVEAAALEADARARVATAGGSLLADVSFADADADAPLEGASDDHFADDDFDRSGPESDDDPRDPFARPLAGPRAGSLTEGLLLQLKRDLHQQTRPRRRVASPAPSGRRAS